MALVTMRDVTVSFGDPPLLEEASLIVEPGERVCIVGRNGAGKTTLLRLLAGEATPDSGAVETGRGVRVGYLPQEVPDQLRGKCVGVIASGLDDSGLDPAERARKAEEIISRLELDGAADVETLSGGLKRRVLLARALVKEPELLLLDEPTNHLDISSIAWMEGFLDRFPGAIVFVTHDRVFLRRLASRIVDVDRGLVTSWPGRYEEYLEKKRNAMDAEAARQARFDRKLSEEEVWIRKGVRERRTRNEGRVRALMKMREDARARRKESGKAEIHVQEAGRTSKKIVELEGVSFAYPGGEPIIRGLSSVVYRGDKVGVLGPNGSGKTTLLRLMLGQLDPTDGSVELGDGLQIAYLDQLRGQLDEERTVIENIVERGDKVIIDGKPKHIYSYLQDFLFTPERARTPVWVLSGGERNRLLLAKLFTRPANVIVLDEPTNDLDTETLELLEERLLGFGGTVLFVSHDRAFLDNLATCTLAFEPGGAVVESVGGYSDWKRERESRQEDGAAQQAPKEKRDRRKDQKTGPRKLGYKEGLELESLPGRIEELETRQAEIHAEMADPEVYKGGKDLIGGLEEELARVEGELEAAYARWEELEAVRETFERSRS